MGNLIDRVSWFWLVKLKKYFQLSLFCVFSLLSIMLVLAEISIFTHIDLNVLGHILRADYGFVNTQVVSLVPMVYIAVCTFYGLFHIKFAGLYGFYAHQHTDSPSLMFGSM